MPILYPSTIELAKFCANLVVRAALVALSWVVLLLIGVGLNWVINWVLGVLAAPEYVSNILTQIVIAFIIFLGLAATLTSGKDVFILTIASLRNTPTNSSGNPSGNSDADSQKTPSN